MYKEHANRISLYVLHVLSNILTDFTRLQNGKKITPDIRYKVVEEDNLYTLLIIETVPEDSGTYECVAINSIGEARCQAECLIQPLTAAPGKGKTTLTSQEAQHAKPTIVEPMKALIIKEGQPAVFKCRISGKERKFHFLSPGMPL
jgi:hypothetical protein